MISTSRNLLEPVNPFPWEGRRSKESPVKTAWGIKGRTKKKREGSYMRWKGKRR
jgi:hypothetical protein